MANFIVMLGIGLLKEIIFLPFKKNIDLYKNLDRYLPVMGVLIVLLWMIPIAINLLTISIINVSWRNVVCIALAFVTQIYLGFYFYKINRYK